MDFINRYRKFIIAAVAGLGVFLTVSSDGVISGEDLGAIISAVLGALGVAAIANKPNPEEPRREGYIERTP